MALSGLAAKNAKPRPAPYKLADSGGLYLLVQPAGGKLWRLDYRFLGKRKTLALGKYPAIGLADARKARDAAKRKTDKQVAKFAAGNSFRVIADEYVTKLERERRADVTAAKARWLLGMAYQHIGDRLPLGGPALLGVPRILEARGNYESARRLRSLCGRVFRYAIATGLAARSIRRSQGRYYHPDGGAPRRHPRSGGDRRTSARARRDSEGQRGYSLGHRVVVIASTRAMRPRRCSALHVERCVLASSPCLSSSACARLRTFLATSR